jgi:hypothetical protein
VEVRWCVGTLFSRQPLRLGHAEASFLNQAVETSSFRQRLRELSGRGGFVQLVLRLGYGPRSEPTPRRKLEELLLGEGELPATRCS